MIFIEFQFCSHFMFSYPCRLSDSRVQWRNSGNRRRPWSVIDGNKPDVTDYRLEDRGSIILKIKEEYFSPPQHLRENELMDAPIVAPNGHWLSQNHCFWASFAVRISECYKTLRFGNWRCFLPQGKRGITELIVSKQIWTISIHSLDICTVALKKYKKVL